MPKTHACGWRYFKMSFQLALVVALLAEISRNCKFCILVGHFYRNLFHVWYLECRLLHFVFFIFYFSDYQVKQIMSENQSYWACRSHRKRVKEHLSAIYCGTESSNLTDELRFWVLHHNISTNATNAILTILRQHHHNLPKDTHTLLKTKT